MAATVTRGERPLGAVARGRAVSARPRRSTARCRTAYVGRDIARRTTRFRRLLRRLTASPPVRSQPGAVVVRARALRLAGPSSVALLPGDQTRCRESYSEVLRQFSRS